MKISATIITYNEERNLPRAIESLRCADEIVVIDSGSSDRTVEIAQKLGARVVECPWPGYAIQKNRAADEASHDWILSLDADESLSESLEAEIWQLKKNGPQVDAYTMPRMAQYLGRWIRHSGWYPDRKVRLYHRSKAKWVGAFVHESVKVDGRVGDLDSNLLHFTCASLSEHLKTMDRYTTLAAEQMLAAKVKPSFARMLLDPPWTFFRTYVVKLGFLDGVEGLAIANMAALYNFVKYAKARFMSPGAPVSVRTLHIDTGRTMQGGQWQVLYLVERLKNATLLAPDNSPLLLEARKRGLDAKPLSRILSEIRRADLVHAHDARAHTYGALANFGQSKRLLVVSRRVAFPIKQTSLSRWKYLQADIFLAVSKYVAAKLKNAGVEKGVVRVVYDGIPIPPSPAHPELARVVSVAGKSIDLPGIPVHISTNLFDDLSTASVFLYVSQMEGLGSAVIAAMASGVPVVASGVGGLPEVVEHERTGLIVRDGNYEKAVRRLLDNPQWAAELGAAGREKATREFSVEKMVESTIGAYNEILR